MDVNQYANNLYLDYPIYKEVKSNGELKTYKNSDALAQAIKIWLSSSKGEKIRTRSGGVLIPFIGKLLTTENANSMKNAIVFGLQHDFTPPIEVVNIDVYPNVEKQRWEIDIIGYNATLLVGVNTRVIISNES